MFWNIADEGKELNSMGGDMASPLANGVRNGVSEALTGRLLIFLLAKACAGYQSRQVLGRCCWTCKSDEEAELALDFDGHNRYLD